MSAPLSAKDRLKVLAAEIEAALAGCLRDKCVPEGLLAAMEYSLDAGGKRLRPALCLAFARLFGSRDPGIIPFALAFELIHTYSLIHDDLPAMDDDDLRRGKPSNHKVFGEATAILAGDGLLTEAFGLAAAPAGAIPGAARLVAIAELAKAAGAAGMVGGQALDMDYTGKAAVSLEELADMHARKTGALITAACVCGAILAGAEAKDVARAREYGQNLGAAFQITDDILDVTGDEKTLGKPVGSDAGLGKTTYPSLMGLEKSAALARERVERAQSALAGLTGDTAVFLKDLAGYLLERVS